MLKVFLTSDSKILATVNTPPIIALIFTKNSITLLLVIVYFNLIGLNSYLKNRAGNPN